MTRQHLSAVRQDGIASIIVVFIITILISLISLGFARLMDRALQNVSNNQLGAAADYAAQSGLNDAIAFVKKNPAAQVTNCADITNTSTAIGAELAAKVNLTTDGNTKYTCVLIDPLPGDLAYQNIPPFNSQVVKLASASGLPLSQLMFSWQAISNNPRPLPSGTPFQTERNWGNSNYPPVLRVTLYPISGTTVPAPSQTRTYYLYPNSGGGSVSYSAASGTIVGGRCNTAPSSPFTNTNYQCNAVINNLTSATYYEARITPLYVAADVGIQGIDGGGTAKFKDAQSAIDVTGKSNAAVKRIQARVATGDPSDIIAGGNTIPEDAIRSANTLCKRLIVPSDPGLSSYVLIDPTSVANSPLCGFFNVTIPAPTVNLTANPTSVSVGQSSTLSWTVTTVGPTTCTAGNDGGLSGWTGSKSAAGGSENSGALNVVRTYTFTLTCTNPGGTASDPATVTVSQPAPTVNLTASPTSVTVGSPSTLTWTTTNNPTSCTASNDGGLSTWTGSKATGGSSQSTGNLNTVRTYTFTIICSNSGGSDTASASVVVTSTSSTSTSSTSTSSTSTSSTSTSTTSSGGSTSTSTTSTSTTSSGGGGSCPNSQTGDDGSGRPNACVRSVTAGWASDGSYAVFNIWGSHCYSGLSVSYPGGSAGLTWYASPDDNSSTIAYYFPGSGPIPSGAGTVTVTCSGNGTSTGSTSLGTKPGGGGSTTSTTSTSTGSSGGVTLVSQTTIGGCDWGDGQYGNTTSFFCTANDGAWVLWCKRTYSDGSVTISRGSC